MLPSNATIQELLADQEAEAFSRIPLYREDQDDVVGYVLQREVLKAKADGADTSLSLRGFMRPTPFIPEVATVASAMRQILDRREPIAIAIDEHGGVSGLVTLEDLTETVLGVEIVDESDRIVDQREAASTLRDQRMEWMLSRRRTHSNTPDDVDTREPV
jgi:CBS domain containing-hemolysin-like protein